MSEIERFAGQPIAYVVKYVRQRPALHVTVLAAVVGAVGCSVGCQYGLKLLIDRMSDVGSGGEGVWTAFAILVVLIAGDNLLWRVGGAVASGCFVSVTGDVRSDLFRHLLGHAPDYFTRHPPGAVASRITSAANAIYAIETMFVWNVLPPMLATVASIGFLATVNGEMAGLLTALASAMVAVLVQVAAAGRSVHRTYAERAAKVDGDMVDVITNLPVIRAFNGWLREFQLFDRSVSGEMAARRRSLNYLERIRLSHAVATAAFASGLMAWSVQLWRHGAASAGDVVLVCSLGFTVLHSTRDLAIALVDITQHMARLAETLATLLVPHSDRDRPDAATLVIRGAEIVFDQVQFAYPGETPLFPAFSLHIAPGERIGLIGPSGSGKTTLLKLLQRLHPLQSGRILIDGQDIANATREGLAASVAVVPQEAYLFQRSILENILYGRDGSTPDEAVMAARAACCMDFVETLTQGFDTLVGDRGAKLSGGQRQRIAIARALVKDAPILLLDEATSALDPDSESAVREALDRLMRGRTVIAVAHKLSTLRDFDRIVLIDRGRIVEEGSPAQLSRRDSLYRRLVQREIAHLSPNSERDEESTGTFTSN